jgi:hypothetical protein
MAAYKRPTKDDAELYLRMVALSSNPRMQEAMTWFNKEFKAKDYAEFKEKYPMGSPGNDYFGMIVGGFEVAGAFISHGLLNENLYFDLSGIGFIWDKLGPIIEGQRKEMGPALWENAVWLAERQKKWSKSVWKPKLAWKSTK